MKYYEVLYPYCRGRGIGCFALFRTKLSGFLFVTSKEELHSIMEVRLYLILGTRLNDSTTTKRYTEEK